MEELQIAIIDEINSYQINTIKINYELRDVYVKKYFEKVESINKIFKIELTKETKWLGLCYIDRILIYYKFDKEYLEKKIDVFILACLTIAMKMEETCEYEYSILLKDNQEILSINLLAKIEMEILIALKYRMLILTPYFYIKLICNMINKNDKIEMIENILQSKWINISPLYYNHEKVLALIYNVINNDCINLRYINTQKFNNQYLIDKSVIYELYVKIGELLID